jgi:hypothetical protein
MKYRPDRHLDGLVLAPVHPEFDLRVLSVGCDVEARKGPAANFGIYLDAFTSIGCDDNIHRTGDVGLCIRRS